MEIFNELKSIIEEIEKDVNSFYGKGNKAAGTRVRNAMQEIKAKAQELRVDVLETRKKEEA
ncbi:MAG: histone H1 [Cytophagales bacterium]|nr:histone H1 [Cytophagales bacterium]